MAESRTLPIVLGFLLLLLVSWLWTSRRAVADTKAVRAMAAYGGGHGGYRPIAELQASSTYPPSTSDSPAPPPPPESSDTALADARTDPWDSPALRRRPRVREALRVALADSLREAEHDGAADPLELLAQRLLRRRGRRHSPDGTGPWSQHSPTGNGQGASSTAAAVVDALGTESVGGGAAIDGDGAMPRDPCRGLTRWRRRRCYARVGAASGATNGATSGGNATGVPRLLPYPPMAARRHNLPPKLPTAAMWPPLPPRASAHGSADFRSLGRVAPYRGGDLEQPGELAKAAKARAYRGELILTYGNEAGTAWIANLIFSLRAAGIDHSLVIVMSDEHCKSLNRAPWMISCAWSSWDFGQSHTGGATTTKRYEGSKCKRPMEMRRLWYSRHHYMSRVIEELGLNVAVIDGDMSVRSDFYPELKRPPLDGHNLVYTLDHGPKCGDLNVGFAYCQNCSPRGRAQWVIDEGLRREGYFCGGGPSGDPRKEFEGGGPFWNASDAANVSSGPHAWIPWTTARDQKVYSDVVGGSCCGKPQHRLMFPATHKVLDQYAFMRQWGQRAGCMTMAPQSANGLQTWWHQLLQGASETDAAETVAIATGRLASGWHGTGEGEMAGWAGHWHYKPPAIAHFVGGAPAGGKVDLMQGLSWWLYEADVVAHAVMEETGKKAGMALPPAFFSEKSQRGLLAISGAGARILMTDRPQFVQRFTALRFWLLTLGAVLQRTAVDPQPHCDSPWIPSDKSTHNRNGYRGKWYTPGWPWPFIDGVGVVVGNCSYPHGATTRAESTEECCSVIFGVIKGAKCFETAHHMVLEQALAARASQPPLAVALSLSIDEVVSLSAAAAKERLEGSPTPPEGAIDAAVLRRLARSLTTPILWIDLPEAVANGGALPPIHGLSASERQTIDSLVHAECRSHLKGLLSY